MFNKDDIVKYGDMLGIVQIPSKVIATYQDGSIFKMFNNVLLEDGTIRMCQDEELELVSLDSEGNVV